MAISINIDGNSYELNGLDHPAEEETARKLLTLMEKYAKEDKDLQTKLLKEFKDQLTKLNKEVNTLATATTKPATAPAANRPTNNNNTNTTAATRALNNAAGAANNNSKVLNNLTTSAGFATGAVNSMADGLKEGTSKFTGALGIAGTALKGIGAAAGFAVTSLIGLGAASLSAFMEASKFQGDLAKGGMRFTDSLTSLNSASYNAGMTMEQMTAVVKGSSQAISQLGKGGTNGAARFAQLVAAARTSADSLRGFGFTAQEEAQVRADYLDILRLQGNSETARTMTNGQIIAQSNKMVKGFIGVAAASGKTIDELIKKTKEIAGEDDFGLTVEALGLTAEQSTRVAKNLAVLDAQGLGSLKQVFLEMRTFGTGIGDTATELKTLGIGGQVENFLDRLDKLEPDQIQGELVKFAQTLPTQAIAEFATKAGMVGGPAAKVANELRRLSQLSKKDLDDMAKSAQQKNAALEMAKRREDDANKLQGMINNILLRVAESPGFQQILGQMLYALETYGPQISDSIANIAVGLFEFTSKLFTPQGRQEIMNDISTAFSEIMIGIKRAVLGPLNMYSEQQEEAERALRVATNDRRMAEVMALKDDKELLQKGEELNKLRIQYGEALLRGDEKAMASIKEKIAITDKEIENRKKTLLTDKNKNPAVVNAVDKEKKAQAASNEFISSNYKLAGVVLGTVGALWLLKKGLVALLETAILGKDVSRSGGLIEKISGLFGSKDKAPVGATKGADGRYRDASGKFAKAPVEAPTTAKGVGLGMMSDMSKQFTQALGWVLKAGAIAGAMYMIGKAMPVLAEGAKSFDGVDWESMAKAGTALTTVSVALVALGKIPMTAIFQGLVGTAAVSGAMVLLSLGFSQLVPQLKAFQDLDWETMAKALVALVGLGAVGVAAGAVAVPLLLGSAAIGALGLALSLFPTDTLVALGKLFESVGAVIGGIVTKIAEGVGLIVDKIAALRNSGIEATTVQIERLSQIPSAQLFAAAAGVKALKEALDGFGGGFWDNIGRGITGMFGADRVSEIERAASAMERYKRSISVLSDNGAGEFVLKPIDIGLYTQLQTTLDETKKQINTTFSKKTYEETFVGTTKAIDATYNVKTSKLDITLEQTRNAIKESLKPPYDALKELTAAIKKSISNATSDIDKNSNPNDGGTLGKNEFGESADSYANFVSNFKGKGISGKTYSTPLGKDLVYNTPFKDLTPEQQAQFVDAMAAQEGTNPKNLNMRMNNPGNILWANNPTDQARILKKYARFGITPGDKANGKVYGKFPTMAQGLAAQSYRVNEIAKNNATGGQVVATWLGATGGKKPTLLERAQNLFTPASPEARVPLSTEQDITSIRKPGQGFNQLTLKDGKLFDPSAPTKKDPDGTLTAVSNEDDTQGKILNILEQTYNLHVDIREGSRKVSRFRGFTEG